MTYWVGLWAISFVWTFGIGLQTRCMVGSHYVGAAIMGPILCGIQIFVIRASAFEAPLMVLLVSGTAYGAGNCAAIWTFNKVARRRS